MKLFNTNMLITDVPLILRTDSYKLGHYEQLVEGLEFSYVYLESRYGMTKTMFFGLQYILKRYFSERITMEMIDICEDFALRHGSKFNRKGWELIVERYDGKLPLEFRALPEGTVTAQKTPLMVIVNTDRDFAWLPMYFEALIQRIWYSITVSTRSLEQKVIIGKFANESIDDDLVDVYMDYCLNDFGARGVNCGEGASIGGMSHQVTSKGSDTLEGIWTAEQAYGTKTGMSAYSVFAIEHNVVLSSGEKREKELFSFLVKRYVANGEKVSVLPDTYDTDRALDYWEELKDEVIAAFKEGGEKGCLIIRPDSGHAVTEPVRIVERLMEIFGYKINSKGYKVLPDFIRVIQGDGTDVKVITAIQDLMKSKKFSALNLVFGQGGKLLQAHGRDDGGFAMKASMMTINGVPTKTSKRPKADPNKHSKEGYFCVEFDEVGDIVWKQVDDRLDSGLLQPVWNTGELLRNQTFDEVREVADGFYQKLLLAA